MASSRLCLLGADGNAGTACGCSAGSDSSGTVIMRRGLGGVGRAAGGGGAGRAGAGAGSDFGALMPVSVSSAVIHRLKRAPHEQTSVS